MVDSDTGTRSDREAAEASRSMPGPVGTAGGIGEASPGTRASGRGAMRVRTPWVVRRDGHGARSADPPRGRPRGRAGRSEVSRGTGPRRADASRLGTPGGMPTVAIETGVRTCVPEPGFRTSRNWSAHRLPRVAPRRYAGGSRKPRGTGSGPTAGPDPSGFGIPMECRRPRGPSYAESLRDPWRQGQDPSGRRSDVAVVRPTRRRRRRERSSPPSGRPFRSAVSTSRSAPA